MFIGCETGADWLSDNGVRLTPEDKEGWYAFHELFCTCLDAMDLKHCVLSMNLTRIRERVVFVLERRRRGDAVVANGSP